MMTKNQQSLPKNEEGWKRRLTDVQFRVLRKKETEEPGIGKYLNEKREGIFTCAACGNQLFSSGAKFDSGTGWPSFDQVLSGSVITEADVTEGVERTEVRCAHCNSHLGHLFADGPTVTRKRYCINSVSLDLELANASHESLP